MGSVVIWGGTSFYRNNMAVTKKQRITEEERIRAVELIKWLADIVGKKQAAILIKGNKETPANWVIYKTEPKQGQSKPHNISLQDYGLIKTAVLMQMAKMQSHLNTANALLIGSSVPQT